MAKRFITTELFKDPWYMDLPNKYKLFWIFLITDCDHAGIWQVNYKTAVFYVGEHLEPSECERFLKDRVIKIGDGKYWFIPKFIEFQYGYELKSSNTAVRSVIALLKRYDLVKYLPKTTITDINEKELQRSYKAPKDKNMNKIKYNDKKKYKDFKEGSARETEPEAELQELEAYWNTNLFLPKPVHKDFIHELYLKFGIQKTMHIILEFSKGNFKNINTMKDSLDDNGNIKARAQINRGSDSGKPEIPKYSGEGNIYNPKESKYKIITGIS